MELREYIKVLGRHRLAIIGSVLLLVVIGTGLSFASMSNYTAKVTCLVEPVITIRDTVSSNEMMDRVMPTLAETVLSDIVLQSAVERLHNAFSFDFLRKNTSAVVVPETYLIEIEVKNGDAKQTGQIANAVAESFTEFVNQDNVMGINYRTIIAQAPTESEVRSEGHLVRNGILGGLLGLIVGVGLAMVLDYLDTTVKTRNDAEEILGTSVLAEITVNRTSASESMEACLRSPEIDKSIRTLRANIANLNPEHEFRKIMLVGPESGIVPCLIIADLAKAFAATGRRTLLIDSEIGPRPGAGDRPGLVSFVEGKAGIDDVCQDTNLENLKFLPAGVLNDSQLELYASNKMPIALENLLAVFDTVIILGSPLLSSGDALTLAPLVDAIILVIKTKGTTSSALKQSQALLARPAINLIGSVLWQTPRKMPKA